MSITTPIANHAPAQQSSCAPIQLWPFRFQGEIAILKSNPMRPSFKFAGGSHGNPLVPDSYDDGVRDFTKLAMREDEPRTALDDLSIGIRQIRPMTPG